jgi:L-ascorbate metabolism protein UlaG (beta-lactamase superfamily)
MGLENRVFIKIFSRQKFHNYMERQIYDNFPKTLNKTDKQHLFTDKKCYFRITMAIMNRREFLQASLSGVILVNNISSGKEKLETIYLSDSFFSERDNTILAWLGMAGAVINSRGTVIFIDPLISYGSDMNTCESGNRLLVPLPVTADKVPKADFVCYTHADSDHYAEKTARILSSRLDPTFICPVPVAERLEKAGIDQKRIIRIKDFAVYSFGDIEITITPALHDWQEVNPWKREDCCGYLVKTPDGTIWHPGDTRLIPELEKIKDVDILFFDVANVDSHLGPKGSARLAHTSGAKLLIAYHYGTFDLPPGSYGGCDPDDSLPYIKDLKAVFLKPNPGEIIRLPV